MPEPKIMPPGHDNPLQPAIIIYLVYAASYFIPFAAVGALVYAYVERGNDPVLDTHLDFQIRTFWWGLLMLFVGAILTLVVVGVLVILFWFVWTLVRIITGFQLAQKQQPISGVELFGLKAI